MRLVAPWLLMLGFRARSASSGLGPSQVFPTGVPDGNAGAVRLRVLSWNVAAVNNNPFEYWITHPNPAYRQLMQDVERFILQPGDDDVPVHEVFSDSMFSQLMDRMRQAGLPQLDTVERLWQSQYRSRKVVSGFLRDKEIGKKRLASMPDRVTNTIQLHSGNNILRPTVINCFQGDLSDLDLWFQHWLRFFFDDSVDVDGKGTKKIYSLLQPIRKKKYPAVSEEEEAASIPLQLVLQGVFDAVLVNLMNAKGGENWGDLRRDICQSLNSKKKELIKDILTTTYKDADVIFLQEAGNELVQVLRDSYAASHHLVLPRSYSTKRAQNSVMLLRASLFGVPEEVEVPADGWEDGDLLLVRGQVMGMDVSLASFHGDTNGLLTMPMLSKVWKHIPLAEPLVFGMDANTHEHKVEGKAHVLEFEEMYRALGLQASWGEVNPKFYTTFNARTYLQPQLNKAAKSTELAENGDQNPKDFVLCTKHFKVLTSSRDNTGQGRYVEDQVFPTLDFPSDHAAITADLLLETGTREEL